MQHRQYAVHISHREECTFQRCDVCLVCEFAEAYQQHEACHSVGPLRAEEILTIKTTSNIVVYCFQRRN